MSFDSELRRGRRDLLLTNTNTVFILRKWDQETAPCSENPSVYLHGSDIWHADLEQPSFTLPKTLTWELGRGEGNTGGGIIAIYGCMWIPKSPAGCGVRDDE